VDKTCAADVANCAPTKKQLASRDKEVGAITKQYAAAGRGLHSSAFQINVSTICGICLVHYFPPIY
jgi:hypothetical protein